MIAPVGSLNMIRPGNSKRLELRRLWPLALAVALAAACSGGEKGAQGSSPSATAVSETTTPTQSPSLSGDPAAMLASLFTDPRPRPPDATRRLPPRPATPFSNWDGRTVMVYDIESRTENNLGEGAWPSFSSDGKWLAFNLDTSVARAYDPNALVRLINLSSGARDEIPVGPGLARFVDDSHLIVPRIGEIQAMDIRTREVVPISQLDDPVLRAKLRVRAGSGEILTPDGKYVLVRLTGDRWEIREIATDTVALELAATEVAAAGPDEFVLATIPQCRSHDGTLESCRDVLEKSINESPQQEGERRYATGTTNIFLVNIRANTVEFVATTGNTWPTANWPLAADSHYVIWTDSYCGPVRGTTHIYDRSTKKLTDTDAPLWVKLLPNGLIGVDDFGPKALLDPATLQWKITLPANVTDVVTSPDGRYLAVGAVLGHGGLCG